MKRALAVALVLAAAAPPASAQAKKGADSEDEDEDEEEEEAETPAPATAEADDSGAGSDEEADEDEDEDEDDEPTDEDGLPEKQNLTGRDEGTQKSVTEFERNRFFVDKIDTPETADQTLIQGSMTSSSFFYGEKGGNYPNMLMAGANGDNAGTRRAFTELRLQTDFRHIKGSRWEARADLRGRFVPQPANDIGMPGAAAGLQPSVDTTANRIQSGFLGRNELDVRELWLIRSGKRSDVYIGRQFVPDLGGFKFDGLRVDYAKSAKLTLIGFAGLLPIRGSRSVTTDYATLEDDNMKSAGRLAMTGGFGGAYRTVNAYGAIGGGFQAPVRISAETPRVYLTSNGYLRSGPKLDVYHYVLLDLVGTAASESTAHIQLTNVSGGINYKPSQRLRLTAAYHRVDTETLNVQANAFLNDPDTTGNGGSIIQSDTYLQRIATDTARVGVSAGLGKQQRFELSTAISFRYRPEFTLLPPDPTAMTRVPIPAASSVEVWGSFVDRRSIAGTRIGIDGVQSFKAGDLAYQRSVYFLGRLFVLREIAGGRGEWEFEGAFSQVKDTVLGMNLGCAMVSDCYGT